MGSEAEPRLPPWGSVQSLPSSLLKTVVAEQDLWRRSLSQVWRVLPEGLSLPRLPIFLMSRFPFYRHLPLELLPAYKWLVIESGFSHRATKPNFKIIPFIKNESRTKAIWYHWYMTPTNLSMNQKRNHGHREQTGGPQEGFILTSFYLRKESTG